MMITAFEKERLHNTFLIRKAEELKLQGFINAQQLTFIESKLPAYHGHSNVFARLGLFVLGFLLYNSCLGFLTVIFFSGGGGETVMKALLFLGSIAGFVVLELLLINGKFYFAQGMDDAFLFTAQLNLISFFATVMAPGSDNYTAIFFVAFIISLICCIRYADSFSALMACLALTAGVCSVCLSAGDAGMQLLPFIMLLLASGIYLAQRQLAKKLKGPYYKKSLHLCFAFSLLLFYTGGNYFVVRQAGETLMHNGVEPGQDIPMAFFFYTFSAVVPIGFIYFALRNKNRLLLWTGILCTVLSIFTFRYYYHLVPAEAAMMLGGLALFALAFFTQRKLKGKTSGLTSDSVPDGLPNDLLGAEALWLAEHYHKGTSTAAHTGAEAGGGSFGGGGSAGTY